MGSRFCFPALLSTPRHPLLHRHTPGCFVPAVIASTEKAEYVVGWTHGRGEDGEASAQSHSLKVLITPAGARAPTEGKGCHDDPPVTAANQPSVLTKRCFPLLVLDPFFPSVFSLSASLFIWYYRETAFNVISWYNWGSNGLSFCLYFLSFKLYVSFVISLLWTMVPCYITLHLSGRRFWPKPGFIGSESLSDKWLKICLWAFFCSEGHWRSFLKYVVLMNKK